MINDGINIRNGLKTSPQAQFLKPPDLLHFITGCLHKLLRGYVVAGK